MAVQPPPRRRKKRIATVVVVVALFFLLLLFLAVTSGFYQWTTATFRSVIDHAKELRWDSVNATTNKTTRVPHNSSSSLLLSFCLLEHQINSEAWLQGPRVGNIQLPQEWLDPMMEQQQQQRLLHPASHHIDSLFNQTLCYASGRFRNLSSRMIPSNNDSSSDQQQVQRDWEFRLLYLAIHRHLHMPAYPEYQQRQRQCAPTAPSSDNAPGPTTPPPPKKLPILLTVEPGNYDYECPNAKFLITVVNTISGMGAVLKNGLVPSLYMALATDRIPLFLHNVHGLKGQQLPNNNNLQQPLLLSSCSRRDWQCVFLPTSPCVLSIQDIQNATVLSDDESRALKQRGYLHNSILNQTKVVILGTSMSNSLIGIFPNLETIQTKLMTLIRDMLQDWKQSTMGQNVTIPSELWKIVTAAADSIAATPYHPNNNNTNKIERKQEQKQQLQSRYMSAALLYLMRPNPMARQIIQEHLTHALATTVVQNTTTTTTTTHTTTMANRQYFGLPIRGSDKCRRESTCLPFDRYVERMVQKWNQHGIPGQRGTIILTSEDPSILPLRLPYSQNRSFPLDFVVNPRDVQPGTGKSRQYQDRADDIIISSLAVLKLQLQSSVIVGNCCSNFHQLLLYLVNEGCGADPHGTMECLNAVDDPHFRICCGWTQSGTCKDIWNEHIATRRSEAAVAAATATTVVSKH